MGIYKLSIQTSATDIRVILVPASSITEAVRQTVATYPNALVLPVIF